MTIGLAWLLVFIEWRGWRHGDEDYVRAGRFFGKILGLTFAVGVATGIVMEFQFGTNWAEYSKCVGDIFGAPLAAEAIFAFFLESAFLGLYLFGRGKVSSRELLHPTQKPVELLVHLVKAVTRPDDLVLDPTAGTASAGVACLQTQRRFIGIELDPHYARTARHRLARAVRAGFC